MISNLAKIDQMNTINNARRPIERKARQIADPDFTDCINNSGDMDPIIIK